MPMTFPLLNFEQTNPVLAGARYYGGLESQGLQNALLRNQLRFAPQQAEAQLANQMAQAKRNQALASLPYGGMTLPGIAGQYQGLELLGAMYGKNSPQYMQAIAAQDAAMKQRQVASQYQQALTESMGRRYLTPLGKSYIEEQSLAQGLAPSGEPWNKQQLAPQVSQQWLPQDEMQREMPQLPQAQKPEAIAQAMAQFAKGEGPSSTQQMRDVYQLERIKKTGLTDAMKRANFAQNMEKTIDMINPDSLAKFSGAAGQAELMRQQGLAAFGKESNDYDEYAKNAELASALATQIRQFYGESIQPEMRQKLEALTNPTAWNKSPKLVKQQFSLLKNLLARESETFTSALQSPKGYMGPYEGQAISSGTNNDPLGIR